MRAIDALYPLQEIHWRRRSAAVVAVAALVLTLSTASLAGASEVATGAPLGGGQAATGESLFYPCSSCHPVTGPVSGLPNDFKKHQIRLVGHDKLGVGDAACLVCHDEPSKDPSKLKLIDGTLTDIKGDVAGVCYRCHSDKYKEWKSGIHGKDLPKCTAAGCHDPHTPAWIYAEPLLPFVGTGFEVRTVSDRQGFRPLASAPVPPPVETAWWLRLIGALGALWALGVVGFLILGRPKQS